MPHSLHYTGQMHHKELSDKTENLICLTLKIQSQLFVPSVCAPRSEQLPIPLIPRYATALNFLRPSVLELHAQDRTDGQTDIQQNVL